jgi:hypothetical protein
MIPITYALAVSAFTLICGLVIHVVYKRIRKSKGYTGITLFESLIICIGSIPGLGGCAAGWAGFGIPLPLILGVPFHIILLGNKSCGWAQSLLFEDPYLTKKFASFPIAWALTSVILILFLYVLKLYNQKKANKPFKPTPKSGAV